MKSQYKRIKEACLINNKMVCQVATDGVLRKKNAQSIATKILLQIIAKKGNTLWVPQFKANIDNAMLVGMDNASLHGDKFILAACGTVNSTFTSVYSKVV
jgi:argonaute-like protein implicated in RNA metabolism and viral defense